MNKRGRRRRRLGQHYLVDDAVVREVIRQVPHGGTEQRILEIGTGRGILTSELSKLTSNLEAFEIDPANFELTEKAIIDSRSVKLRLGDAFEEEPGEFDVLVSSLPYSESSRFVEWLSSRTYTRAVVILQEDFVSKMLALPGRRNYRAISVIAQSSFRAEVLRQVPRSSFEPQPRVNSQLVTISPISRLDADVIGFIKRLFSVKKRKVGVALKVLKLRPGRQVTSDVEQRRVYQIEPAKLRRIAEEMLSGDSAEGATVATQPN
jgi:16S rRNA A1518/A1519 N6-dimethyltransferase RsmA/KsgA/DIM1 with predicted DNA glycosylase/AP lyase activity